MMSEAGRATASSSGFLMPISLLNLFATFPVHAISNPLKTFLPTCPIFSILPKSRLHRNPSLVLTVGILRERRVLPLFAASRHWLGRFRDLYNRLLFSRLFLLPEQLSLLDLFGEAARYAGHEETVIFLVKVATCVTRRSLVTACFYTDTCNKTIFPACIDNSDMELLSLKNKEKICNVLFFHDMYIAHVVYNSRLSKKKKNRNTNPEILNIRSG